MKKIVFLSLFALCLPWTLVAQSIDAVSYTHLDVYKRQVENYGGHSRDVGNTYEAKALLSWELDLWGNLRWKKVAAVAEYLQSVEAQRALRMTIVAEVAQAYYELVALDTELEIVRQTQKAREEGVRLARIRFEGGLTSETSYQQAQVELARTATLVPDLERRISLKENDISFLVGEFPTRIKRVNFLQELDVPESLPVGLPSDLLERRPDVRVAEQQLRAEHARVKVAYTNMFPRLAPVSYTHLDVYKRQGYVILTWPKKVESEAPTVIVESAEKGDVEIYGEYVGRIRAQQFVEVRARVEGYLENMLFAEGTYVTKNQVLFVINQDQYRAKADKARAQLKKDVYKRQLPVRANIALLHLVKSCCLLPIL